MKKSKYAIVRTVPEYGKDLLKRFDAPDSVTYELIKNRPRGKPRPICIETDGAYTGRALGQRPLAFWRHMSPSKNLAQGKLRTQLWWHHA